MSRPICLLRSLSTDLVGLRFLIGPFPLAANDLCYCGYITHRFCELAVVHSTDFMGAFFCEMGAFLGWVAVWNHMDLQFIVYWGLFGFYLAIIELLKYNLS